MTTFIFPGPLPHPIWIGGCLEFPRPQEGELGEQGSNSACYCAFHCFYLHLACRAGGLLLFLLHIRSMGTLAQKPVIPSGDSPSSRFPTELLQRAASACGSLSELTSVSIAQSLLFSLSLCLLPLHKQATRSSPSLGKEKTRREGVL